MGNDSYGPSYILHRTQYLWAAILFKIFKNDESHSEIGDVISLICFLFKAPLQLVATLDIGYHRVEPARIQRKLYEAWFFIYKTQI